MKKLYILILLTALIGGTFTACSRDNTPDHNLPVIRIGYLPITHAMPLFVVYEWNSYRNGFIVELERFSNWPDLTDALNGGHIDGASALIQLTMVSHERGVPIRAMALGHRDGNIITVANYIQTVQDLQGRSVAIPSPMSTHYFLLNMLLWENGMTIDDVDVIQMPPTEMVSALASGGISAFVVAEPFGAVAVGADVGRSFAESGEIWENSLCCALVLSENFINSNREIAEEFMRLYHEAGDWLEENMNPISYRLKEIVLGRRLRIGEEALELSLSWISFANLNIGEDEYAVLKELKVELGLSQSPPAFDDFVCTLE